MTVSSRSVITPSSLFSFWLAGGRIVSAPTSRYEHRVLVGRVLPGEVPRVDDVELAVRQPLVEELGVDRWHRQVLPAGDDLHRYLDLRQEVAQDWQLGRVGAHVAHRLDHPVALVGGEVVLADEVR